MPRKPTPAAKQRVRTGCLTCRRRRRKCDEQKPRCANCEVKGFSCKYGGDLAFVSSRAGPHGSGIGQGYSSITFVDDSPLAAGQKDKSKEPQNPLDETQGNADFTDGLQSSAGSHDDTGDHRVLDFQPILSDNVPGVGFSGRPIPFVERRNTPDARFLTSPPYFGHASPVATAQTVERQTLLVGGNQETDLLRHFRYHVGPWIDTGDPELPFGLQVLLLSRTNRALQAAVLSLSAGQRLLLPLATSEDAESSRRFRKEAQESLAVESNLARYAGQTLLMLQDVLPAGPQQWRRILMYSIEQGCDFSSQSLLGEEVGEALFWLYFRLDIASCITSAIPPLIPFRSLLRRDGTLIQHSQTQIEPQTVNGVYKNILCLLGHCLALMYGGPDIPPRQATSPGLAFPSLRQSQFLSEWTFLWTDCQKWYNERPVDVQQIVDIRGGEADQIDPDHNSSFPILIYTTPMALVANAAYHITSLLLLTHKPRLLKSLPGPRCYTSHIWHAQSIAGIAASNDSPEQWDPILVASLLTIARDMTHESQQTVLLERLARITATTGMKLDQETEALQATWNMARYEEEFDESDI
ncbi:uncharacterized protein N7511_003797 [Penicillium nucicola]|uniref:uncharacterized protein n=1 Tax=Penicillium nucicola TaxID=1850975 RepID=UPI002544E88A|nr:uncharacterized protein N7511_003797 [Penicillium nucicola]KAJ5766181.1 hypothetical protein N7511_003797 [Penicillium nucicola]